VSTVSVEEVGKGATLRQFLDLPVALGEVPPGADWLLAVQRRRIRSGQPHGEGNDAVLLLARRGGRPVGRISAHVSAPGAEARFGFFAVEGPDDADVTEALLGAAATWAAGQGRTSLVGPLSWGPEEEAGVLVAGHDQPPVTGRAWTPSWYGPLLAGTGLTVLEELKSFRLPVSDPADGDAGRAGLAPGAALAVPVELEPYRDPALLLAWPDGEGAVVAVPDVAGTMAGRPGGRSVARGAWSLARQARKRRWDGCVVLALDGPEDVLVAELCAAAGRAGYQWVLSPWAPNGTEPVMVHRLYEGSVSDLASP
jgi:hypothetical protein